MPKQNLNNFEIKLGLKGGKYYFDYNNKKNYLTKIQLKHINLNEKKKKNMK